MNFGLPKDRDDRAKMFLGDDFYGQCAATIYCGTPDEGKTGDMVYIPKNIEVTAPPAERVTSGSPLEGGEDN